MANKTKMKVRNDSGDIEFYHNYDGPIPTYTGSTGYSISDINHLKKVNPETYQSIISKQRDLARGWLKENMGEFPFIKILVPELGIDEFMRNEKAEKYRMIEGQKYDMEGDPIEGAIIDSMKSKSIFE